MGCNSSKNTPINPVIVRVKFIDTTRNEGPLDSKAANFTASNDTSHSGPV